MMLKRQRIAKAAIGATVLSALLVSGLSAPPPALAFGATAKATVINYLNSISGTNIVSGQHNKEPASSPSQYTLNRSDFRSVLQVRMEHDEQEVFTGDA